MFFDQCYLKYSALVNMKLFISFCCFVVELFDQHRFPLLQLIMWPRGFGLSIVDQSHAGTASQPARAIRVEAQASYTLGKCLRWAVRGIDSLFYSNNCSMFTLKQLYTAIEEAMDLIFN